MKGRPVPSDKKRRAPARSALAIALTLAFGAPAALGAGLGRLSVQSALGQPLQAEVEVPSVARDESGSLQVRLASAGSYRQAGLDFNSALAQLRFTLERRGDASYVVRMTSLQPVNEPYLDILLELTWATGRVLREYTVLLDPPSLRTTPDLVPPVAAPRPLAPLALAPAPVPLKRRPRPHPRPAVPRRAARRQRAAAVGRTRCTVATRWRGSPARTALAVRRSTRCWWRCFAPIRAPSPIAT